MTTEQARGIIVKHAMLWENLHKDKSKLIDAIDQISEHILSGGKK